MASSNSNVLDLALETFDRLRYKIPDKPKQIQIEITNRCNMDCSMCPREVMGIDLEHMEWDKFVGVVDKLNQGEEVVLTGWGEPFLHPRIFDMIAHCKARGHKVMITSNGLFTRSNIIQEILNSEVDALTFSIDSLDGHVEDGHTNNKVLENIEALAGQRKGQTPSLRLQATLHKGCEEDLYDVIRYGAKFGFDIINVGRIDRKYDENLKRPSLEEEKKAFKEAERIAQSVGIQLDWLQYSVSSGLSRWVYKAIRKKLHRSGQYCLKTFNYAYVNRDGDVTPCCLLPQTKMGNLIDGDLQSIWKSDQFNDFRENYRDTCGSCDLWTIDMVDK